MSKSIKPDDLGDAIRENLEIYSQNVLDAINEAGENAIKKLVKLTKATAPVSRRKGGGSLKRNITSTRKPGLNGDTFIWHVKAPDHRIVHLVVHGHATRTGGRTKSNPFLKNAVDAVLPEYEKAIEEAVKND